MIVNFFRHHQYAAVAWLLLRLYLGFSWLHHSIEKFTGGFSAEGFLANAVANPVMREGSVIYPNYVAFLDHVALPNAAVFNVLIPVGEMLVGLGLIAGVLTPYAAFFGVVMNMSFLMTGTVSTNPWMVGLSFFLIVAGANAGRYGGDRWVMPFLRDKFGAPRHPLSG